jgi:hypothetical protein
MRGCGTLNSRTQKMCSAKPWKGVSHCEMSRNNDLIFILYAEKGKGKMKRFSSETDQFDGIGIAKIFQIFYL